MGGRLQLKRKGRVWDLREEIGRGGRVIKPDFWGLSQVKDSWRLSEPFGYADYTYLVDFY